MTARDGDASDDGESVGDETDSPAVSEPEDGIAGDAGAEDEVSPAPGGSAEDTDDSTADAIDDAQPGQDVPDPTDDADEPDTGAVTARDDDASIDGKGVGDETDSPAVSEPEDGVTGNVKAVGSPASGEDSVSEATCADGDVFPTAEQPDDCVESKPNVATGNSVHDAQLDKSAVGSGKDDDTDQLTDESTIAGTGDGTSDDIGTESVTSPGEDDSTEGEYDSMPDAADDARPDDSDEDTGTEPSVDASVGGEIVETSKGQATAAGPKGGASDDVGKGGELSPAADNPAEDANDSPSDAMDDAQPGQDVPPDPTDDAGGSGTGSGTAPGVAPSEDDDVVDTRESEKQVAKLDLEFGTPGNTETSEEIGTPKREPVILPTFDVVRVDQFNFATIAGRGAPNWQIDVLINSELKESDTIGRDGQFAFVFQLDTEGGQSEIALLSRDGDGTVYRSPETVVILAPESVEVPESEEIPLASTEPLLPAVLIATPESVKLTQPPIPDQPAGNPGENLQIDSITYDMDGEVVLAGRGSPNGFIKIYLNNLLVKTEQITDFGTWEVALPAVDAGRYMLKVEELDQSKKVVASVTTPFQREFQRDALEKMKEAAQASGKNGVFDVNDGRIADIVTVQPGYTLWEISRRSFGQGRFYVRIYHTNINQIDDPDLIFPGQLLVVPNFDTAPPRRPFPN